MTTMMSQAVSQAYNYFTSFYGSNHPASDSVKIETGAKCRRAEMFLTIPKEPPSITNLVFCIDTSRSMGNQRRRESLDKNLNKLINTALKVADSSRKIINIGIVGFDKDAIVICPVTQINSQNVLELQKKIKDYQLNSGTNIPGGLALSRKQLDEMAQKTKNVKQNILVLLTDGGANSHLNKEETLNEIGRMENLEFFAIGIGNKHDKELLKTIAQKNRGQYIDTTLKSCSITSAIQNVINKIQPVARSLTLQAKNLSDNQWYVYKCPSPSDSKCELGEFLPGNKITIDIIVQSEVFQTIAPSKLCFALESDNVTQEFYPFTDS